jgi:hypothetical protein
MHGRQRIDARSEKVQILHSPAFHRFSREFHDLKRLWNWGLKSRFSANVFLPNALLIGE